jgi:hypothetical protein
MTVFWAATHPNRRTAVTVGMASGVAGGLALVLAAAIVRARDTRRAATCCMPIPVALLERKGSKEYGRERLGAELSRFCDEDRR